MIIWTGNQTVHLFSTTLTTILWNLEFDNLERLKLILYAKFAQKGTCICRVIFLSDFCCLGSLAKQFPTRRNKGQPFVNTFFLQFSFLKLKSATLSLSQRLHKCLHLWMSSAKYSSTCSMPAVRYLQLLFFMSEIAMLRNLKERASQALCSFSWTF